MDCPIAIVGMSCRFAGCPNAVAFWEAIRTRRNLLTPPGPEAELSPVQFKMLVALAVRGGRNVQSAEFLLPAAISNAASARKALNRLAELRRIYKYRGEWRFNGNFFRAWLKRFA